jgi:hypothetical protein
MSILPKLRDDLTGKTFENLYVIGFSHMTDYGSAWYTCRCELCGTIKPVRARNLKNGDAKSCGCVQYTHRKLYPSRLDSPFDNRLYKIWKHMLSRCYNESDVAYNRYGAIGITVCAEWKNDLHTFIAWANNNGYSERLTLDRVKNEKGYCPDNCRFVSARIQNINRKNSIYFEIDGETKALSEWAELYNQNYSTVWRRLNKGMSILEALETRSNSGRKRRKDAKLITVDGVSKTAKEWSKETGVHSYTIFSRIKSGWSNYDAVMTPATK